MKHIEEISGNDMLHIINSTADPDINFSKVRYLKLGENYFVYFKTGYGSFLSDPVKYIDKLDAEEEKVRKQAESVKAQTINPTNTLTGLWSIKT